MNYSGKRFGTAEELRGVVSRSMLREFTPSVRVAVDPNDQQHPEGEVRDMYQEKVNYYGLWFNLADLAECIVSGRSKKFRITVCRKLGIPTDGKSLADALGNHCLSRRRVFLAHEMQDTERYRTVFPVTIDDAVMQSFGYKPGTSVRALEEFLRKRPSEYNSDDYCVVRVPDQRSLDFTARRMRRVEIWVRPETFAKLHGEPEIARSRRI